MRKWRGWRVGWVGGGGPVVDVGTWLVDEIVGGGVRDGAKKTMTLE